MDISSDSPKVKVNGASGAEGGTSEMGHFGCPSKVDTGRGYKFSKTASGDMNQRAARLASLVPASRLFERSGDAGGISHGLQVTRDLSDSLESSFELGKRPVS